MEIGTVLSVAQTLFAALQCLLQLKEICSYLGKLESQLVEFKNTVETVKAVLLDAQDKEIVTNKHEAELYIQRLKDAVYDADDLFDEFVTLAEQNQLKGGKVSKKLRNFFSRRNPFAVAHNMSEEVNNIKKALEAIAKDRNDFGFNVDSRSTRSRREETLSYVYERNIIGREDDLEKIIGFLLDSNVKDDVSFLTIVGIGGLGKTALAQLVFNDARVTKAFPLMMWTCVSDHEQEEFDVQGILRKMLASTVGKKDEGSTIHSVQTQLRKELASNKYLIVLDDVWTENRNQWINLVDFLLGGQKGSWILVTTRSHETAKIVGSSMRYELQGLSEENSRLLFEKIAFGSEQPNPHEDLVKVGREIVEECVGVPLAIRVAGSLLYGQDKSKWLSFHKSGLFNLRNSQKGIMPILKLSYNQLESPLKSCFTYCALFPKDFEMEKELLTSLWMAQGFIVPLDEGQTMDDAAEEYFSILLQRCFLQDIKHDKYGGIYSCKMHDLLHELAQQVAGKEICVANSVISKMDEKVRHLALLDIESSQQSFSKAHIRSYLVLGKCFPTMPSVKAFACLRAMDMSCSSLKSLPDSIGELLHLRFLDLSWNRDLKVLPKSITKLYNLETLKLVHCSLKEFSKKLSTLVKLRILDLEGCDSLTHMPRGMSNLSCLHTLSKFVVNSSSWKQLFDELEELKRLERLKGKLHISIHFPCNDAKIKQVFKREGGYLRNLQYLSDIRVVFKGTAKKWGEEALGLVEELQPHANVKMFIMTGFDLGKERCGREINFKLPLHSNLVTLELKDLTIEHVTCLGNLPHLKTLELCELSELEYMIFFSATSATSPEIIASSTPGRLTMSTDENLSLFPSLEELRMEHLPKMKGWRSRMGVGDNNQLLSDTTLSMEPLLLPRLMTLRIFVCPNLKFIMQCPVMVKLELHRFNKGLQIIKALSRESGDAAMNEPSSSFDIPNLRVIRIDDVKWLNSLPTQAFRYLLSLTINEDEEVVSLGEVSDVVFRSMTSLGVLKIYDCSNLRSVCGGLRHLTYLEELDIRRCRNLERQDGIDTDMLCPSLHHSLHHVTLKYLPQLVDLPNWMQFLKTLQTLVISGCGLEFLPNWMPKLTSLQQLKILHCPERLKERCQDSTGEDWPLIKHIPSKIIV